MTHKRHVHTLKPGTERGKTVGGSENCPRNYHGRCQVDLTARCRCGAKGTHCSTHGWSWEEAPCGD